MKPESQAHPHKTATRKGGSAKESHPHLVRVYDEGFVVTDAYKATLPDMQNASGENIQGARVPILQVGISNFRLPLRFATAAGGERELETSVTGTVSLCPDSKGINMSRVMRTFYEFKDEVFSTATLGPILERYKSDLGSRRARIRLTFDYPLLRPSLRSGLEGWQYYQVSYEGMLDETDHMRLLMHFDFVYSSACPCSAELSEHARHQRHQYAIPHSQRSKARVSVQVRPGSRLGIEDLHALCLDALKTETQVMVKREDEQAFAELNGAYIKFVEDAARLLHAKLDAHPDILDFEAACSHLESLHSHDAVAVINKGIPGGFKADFSAFRDLVC